MTPDEYGIWAKSTEYFQGEELEFVWGIMRDWARDVSMERLHLGQRSTIAYIAEHEPNEARHARIRLAIIDEEIARRTAAYIDHLEVNW